MPVSPQDWEKIKQAAIAGVPYPTLCLTFPDLTLAALRKRAQRGDWPTPERVAFLATKCASAQLEANGAMPGDSPDVLIVSQSCPTGQNSPMDNAKTVSQGQAETSPSAMSVTLEATKGLVNASLGRFVQRAVKRVDQWDIPAPQSMKDGLALVNSLARLHQPAPQHLSQVNMQFVSPWGTAGAKFLEVEVETPEEP